MLFLQVQMTNVEKSETKMIDLQEENDVLLVRNRELIERVSIHENCNVSLFDANSAPDIVAP